MCVEVDHLSMWIILGFETTIHTEFDLPVSEYACQILSNTLSMEMIEE